MAFLLINVDIFNCISMINKNLYRFIEYQMQFLCIHKREFNNKKEFFVVLDKTQKFCLCFFFQ